MKRTMMISANLLSKCRTICSTRIMYAYALIASETNLGEMHISGHYSWIINDKIGPVFFPNEFFKQQLMKLV